MSWDAFFKGLGEVLGAGLGAAAVTAVIKRWMEIDDPTTLRLTIRNDLRNNDFKADSVELMVNSLKGTIRNFATMGDRRSHNKAILVQETLIEEAERLHII